MAGPTQFGFHKNLGCLIICDAAVLPISVSMFVPFLTQALLQMEVRFHKLSSFLFQQLDSRWLNQNVTQQTSLANRECQG